MTYRTIAVHVNESSHAVGRITLAAQLANASQSNLIGVAATALPQSYYLGGMTGLDGDSASALNAYLDFMKERATNNLATFEAIVDKAGVRNFERRIIEDEAGAAMCLQARYSDLLVVSQSDPEESLPAEAANMSEYVVMNSCRPVLLIPYAGEFTKIDDRVLIAWDGSPQAARAISGAIPLLRQALVVEIAVFNPDATSGVHGQDPGADIALYLARHSVNVEVSRQAMDNDIDIGNAMLSHVADTDAKLIIMGAYGHSPLREILLGGATRTILQSMTVPVLMSH